MRLLNGSLLYRSLNSNIRLLHVSCHVFIKHSETTGTNLHEEVLLIFFENDVFCFHEGSRAMIVYLVISF